MKRNVIVTSLFLVCFTLTSTVLLKATSIIDDHLILNFEDFDLGHISRQILTNHGYSVSNWDNNLETNAQVIENNGNKALQVFYPEGGYNSKGSGIQFELNLNPGYQYKASYDFMMSKDFSYGGQYEGGKLPGITAGNRCSGTCDGTDGFAARYMWRRDGAGELYLCNVDKTSQYCDDYYFTDPNTGEKYYFKPGVKYNISEIVTLNSGPNNYDGSVVVSVNNQEVLNLQNIRLVTNDQLIDTFYFSTFHGGNSELWGPLNDSYIYFDNIDIQKLK